MMRINIKHLTSAILLAFFIALLLMQLVRASPITISIAPIGGPVGTSVLVSGFADTPGGTVNIYFDVDGDALIDPEELQKSITADTEAPYIYTDTIIVPPSAAGTHAITATDVTAGESAGAGFTVVPQMTVGPESGPIGTVITVIGTGFARTSTITITFEDIDVTPSPAPVTNDVGSFTADLSVPSLVEGVYAVTATDAVGKSGTDFFTLFGITISIDPTSGPVGTLVTVGGTQATPGGEVTILWDNVEVDSVTATQDGTYLYDLTVQPSTAGEHTVTAQDIESANSATETFTVEPRIILSIIEGPVDTELTVTGTGFAANAYVDISFDTILVVDDLETDSVGGFEATLNVPASVAGIHTVTATDTVDSTVIASAPFTVVPQITIDVTEGPIGITVQVTGTGFTGTSPVTFTFNGVDVTPDPTPVTDEFGSFTASFETPPAPAREYTITATDEDDNEATVAFTLWGIEVFIAPTSGPVGTIVSATGSYATPGGSIIIRWDGAEIETITAGLDGTYSYDLTIPASVTGDHAVTVEDVTSTNTATQTFTVEPQIILTPEDGLVGDSVTVTGTGFSGASQVDVYFDKDKDGLPDVEGLVLDDVPTDEFGSFEVSFSIPWLSTADNYLITAVDEEGVTDNAIFTVLFVTYTRGSEYFQGDYPSFFIQVVDGEGEPLEGAIVVMEISDPNGYLQYRGITLTIENGTVPYDMQFFNWWIWYYMETFELTPLHLPSDALVGSWKWTATTNGLMVNGSFEVIEPVDLRTLLEKLDQLLEGQTDIKGLIVDYYDKLHLDHQDLIFVINEVATRLEMDHDDLADLITEVFNELGIKLDDIKAEVIGIEAKVDGLYVVIDDLAVKLEDINAQLVEVQDGIAAIITDIGTIRTDITDINAKIATIEGRLVTIETDIGTIKVDIASIDGEITSINGRLATIATSIATIQTDISAINGRLTGIEGNIATIATDIGTIKTDISDIGGTLLSVDGRLATIETDIGSIQVNIAEINGEITSINERLVDITSAIGTIQTDISTINGRLASIEGSIATIITDLGTIKTDVSSINAKITAIEGRLATIETDIGTIKVDLEDIEAELEDINGAIATINTALGRIEAKIDNLGAVSLEEIKADIATIKSDIGTIKVNVNNINANITSIKGRIATVETTLGTMQVDIDDINGRIEQLEGTTATIKTDIGTMKVSLTDINAKITVMNNNEATIQTDIGTIKGTLTEVQDNVATIETDVGTVRSSTESIETTSGSIKSDTSWQTPTVALSLIAAIAAIAAAVLVLRKVYMK